MVVRMKFLRGLIERSVAVVEICLKDNTNIKRDFVKGWGLLASMPDGPQAYVVDGLIWGRLDPKKD